MTDKKNKGIPVQKTGFNPNNFKQGKGPKPTKGFVKPNVRKTGRGR